MDGGKGERVIVYNTKEGKKEKEEKKEKKKKKREQEELCTYKS